MDDIQRMQINEAFDDGQHAIQLLGPRELGRIQIGNCGLGFIKYLLQIPTIHPFDHHFQHRRRLPTAAQCLYDILAVESTKTILKINNYLNHVRRSEFDFSGQHLNVLFGMFARQQTLDGDRFA